MKHPIATLIMKNQKRIQMELYYENAPNSVNGLIEAIENHAFDNMTIERIVPGFVLQPWCDETKRDEFYQYVCNGEFKNERHSFSAYCVGLAGDGDKLSVPSCFFITLSDNCEHLNQRFAMIGKVISGFEEIKRLEHVDLIDVPCNEENVSIKKPVKDEIIETIFLEYNGFQPEKVIKYIVNE